MSKLFIVDDDPICQAIAQFIVKKNMLFENCDSYTKARASLNYLIEHQAHPDALPDVILLDLNMPEMNGWDFLCIYEDLLPFLTKQIDVFIVTSSITPSDKLRSTAYPFIQGFISKPLTNEVLRDISTRVTIKSMKCNNIKLFGTVLTDLLTQSKSDFLALRLPYIYPCPHLL